MKRRSVKSPPTGNPLAIPRTYAELIALQAPRPIRDKEDYNVMIRLVDRLAVQKPNKDQADYLEVLSLLVEAYEDVHVKMPPAATGIKLVRVLLAENGMKGDDLGELLGVNRSTAYKLLKGSRNLTTGHIHRIATRFSISADALIEGSR